ncbi:2-methylcitrate dehydratase [bacterium HR26]|nr:2-methylcitrate dehydratase [bacterium HR26]
MTMVEELAAFAVQARYDDLSEAARQQLKIRILDALGCAIGALDGAPIRALRQHLEDFGGRPLASLIGGGRTAPDRAALYNGFLVRYLDYNDSFLAPGETCHPSDNLSAVLAAAEYADASGRDLLTALAVAYQVQCRLSEVAPVRARGFDHVTQGAYAAAAGVARALRLDAARAAHGIAISGTAFNALRVTRTGRLSHWKGLAYPNTAFGATHAVFLAMRGITGPLEVFEGNKGFMDAIAGRFSIDWSQEDLEAVRRTILKKYNAEIHSQSAIEGLLELKAAAGFRGEDIEQIELETFDVAFHIIGGGEEGNKYQVRTKEEADHSLPYMLAVAALDGQLGPEQYAPERIVSQDVQSLLSRVVIRPDDALSRRFPAEMPARLRVILRDGRVLSVEKRDYEGFHTRPMPWERVVEKFEQLASPFTDAGQRQALVEAVAGLEGLSVRDLTQILEAIGKEGTR